MTPRPDRLETRVVKRIDPETFGDEGRHLQQQAQCPRCEQWADLDDDQVAGRISLVCDCGWHGWIDGRAVS